MLKIFQMVWGFVIGGLEHPSSRNHPRHIGGNSDKVNKRFWSRLGGTSTTGIDLETLHWAWQKCNVSHLSLSLYHLCARYNHPEVVTILEENGALDCNWPPHSIIRGVELKTSAAQCYSLMWSQHCIFIFPFDKGQSGSWKIEKKPMCIFLVRVLT